VAASDLFDLALEWKAVCLEAVASTVGGAIAHAFVSPGPPSLDCLPQLSVYPGAPVGEADTSPLSPPLAPGERDRVTGSLHLVNLTCVVVRCIPTLGEGGELPSPSAIEAAARETSEDVWAIWNFTRTRHREGTLFASPSGAREVFLDPAFPIPPGGGAGGWQIPIRVQLGGYSPPP
jgi:hypothetical protein